MTTYEFMVPVVALALTGLHVFGLRIAGKRLDAQIEADRRARHPAD